MHVRRYYDKQITYNYCIMTIAQTELVTMVLYE